MQAPWLARMVASASEIVLVAELNADGLRHDALFLGDVPADLDPVVRVSLENADADILLGLAEVTGRGESGEAALEAVAAGVGALLRATGLQGASASL